MRILTLNVTD